MTNSFVADIFRGTWEINPQIDFARAKASGTVGIIAKASEGATYRDATYAQARVKAMQAGMLWGAYHFGTAANAKDQVANFLNAAAPDDNTVLCLDFENNERAASNTITKDIAIEMLTLIKMRVGQMPVLYTGSFMYDLFENESVADFAPYRVWWARYSDAPELHPTWASYWLWQHTDGHHGPTPRQIDGIGFCDCSTYAGTVQELSDNWAIE